MVGSSQSIAQANFTLNTIVAEILSRFADRLDKAESVSAEVNAIISQVVQENKRVIFNGNNYSDEWVVEATRRGLPNIRNMVDAIASIKAEKNKALMEKHAVLSRVEMDSRCEIQYELYSKTINIEAQTMVEMVKRQIMPAVISFKADLASSVAALRATDIDDSVESDLLAKVTGSLRACSTDLAKLEKAIEKAAALHGDAALQATAYRDLVFVSMGQLRQDVDSLEPITDSEYWPIPSYSEILFNI